MKRTAKREGFALLLALLAVLVISALVMAAAYGVQVDASVAREGTLHRRAVADAESAVWSTLAGANATSIRLDPIGTVRKSVGVDGDVTTTVMLTRTDTSHVWIVADVAVRRGRMWARYRVGMSAVVSEDTTRLGLVPISRHPWLESF